MTAAADKLFLTQPAVSQQIRALEEELGVAILVRGVRKVKATMQGQLLYDYAKRILYLTQQAESALKTISQEVVGSLRVGTINSMGLFLVSPIIGLLLKHNSRLNVKLVYGSYQEVADGMAKNDIDLAILPDSILLASEEEELGKSFLFKDEVVLVNTARDTSVPTLIELEQLKQRPIVEFSRIYPSFLKELNKSMAEKNIHCEPIFEADNVGTLKRVIESGLGWGFMPYHSVKKQLKAGRLTQVRVNDLALHTEINLYYRKDVKLKPLVEVFYRALQQQVLSGT